jgi:hypothetical protein
MYRWGMAALAVGGAWWWYSSGKAIEDKQHAAAEKFGRHGEKVDYGGDHFKASVDHTQHFPGIAANAKTPTNAAGGHDRGTRPGPS